MEETNTLYASAGHSWFDPWLEKDVTCEYQFRKPSRAEINRFNKEVNKSSGAAQNNLVLALIHPDDASRLKADLESYPALLATLANWVLKASGLSDLGN